MFLLTPTYLSTAGLTHQQLNCYFPAFSITTNSRKLILFWNENWCKILILIIKLLIGGILLILKSANPVYLQATANCLGRKNYSSFFRRSLFEWTRENWLVYFFNTFTPPQHTHKTDNATTLFGFDTVDGIWKKKRYWRQKDNKMTGFKETENGD